MTPNAYMVLQARGADCGLGLGGVQYRKVVDIARRQQAQTYPSAARWQRKEPATTTQPYPPLGGVGSERRQHQRPLHQVAGGGGGGRSTTTAISNVGDAIATGYWWRRSRWYSWCCTGTPWDRGQPARGCQLPRWQQPRRCWWHDSSTRFSPTPAARTSQLTSGSDSSCTENQAARLRYPPTDSCRCSCSPPSRITCRYHRLLRAAVRRSPFCPPHTVVDSHA